MKVKLNCTLLGDPPGQPGDVVDLPRPRAERLIEKGMAEKPPRASSKSSPEEPEPEPPPEPEQQDENEDQLQMSLDSGSDKAG